MIKIFLIYDSDYQGIIVYLKQIAKIIISQDHIYQIIPSISHLQNK